MPSKGDSDEIIDTIVCSKDSRNNVQQLDRTVNDAGPDNQLQDEQEALYIAPTALLPRPKNPSEGIVAALLCLLMLPAQLMLGFDWMQSKLLSPTTAIFAGLLTLHSPFAPILAISFGGFILAKILDVTFGVRLADVDAVGDEGNIVDAEEEYLRNKDRMVTRHPSGTDSGDKAPGERSSGDKIKFLSPRTNDLDPFSSRD